MIVIVNYGLCNLRSVAMKFERIKAEAIISAKPADILQADKLVLPGVGYYAAAMRNLVEADLVGPLNEAVLGKKIPILGICLGMQLFTKSSEEGNCGGLGWIDAVTKKLAPPQGERAYRVPHVGWNSVELRQGAVLFEGIDPGLRYYFVHSYAVFCEDPGQIAAATDHGQSFASAVVRDNIHGVQFHPEKSHRHGLAMIENFLRLA